MTLAHYIEVGTMDELGRMDSPIHRLDARVKALTTIAFIVIVMSFPRYEVSALIPFFLYPFALMATANIPPPCILRKLLIASPFALAVGILNPFFDRQIVASIGSCEISGGWMSFISIVIRFFLTVSTALVLVACTGIHRLCAGLERMGLPRVFAVQLQLLYRYLFVIAGEGVRMMRSVEIRSFDRRSIGFATYVSLVGHLLFRAIDRAQRVYQAMASRGFDGQVRVMHTTVICWNDIVFLFGWLFFFTVARMWNIADMLGRFLMGTVT
jgi:cobalt/nickel transport system permease protein